MTRRRAVRAVRRGGRLGVRRSTSCRASSGSRATLSPAERRVAEIVRQDFQAATRLTIAELARARRRQPADRDPLLPLGRVAVLQRVQDPARHDPDRRRRLPELRPGVRRRCRPARAAGHDARRQRRPRRARPARHRGRLAPPSTPRRQPAHRHLRPGRRLGGDRRGRQAPPVPARHPGRRLRRRPPAADVRGDPRSRATRCSPSPTAAAPSR